MEGDSIIVIGANSWIGHNISMSAAARGSRVTGVVRKIRHNDAINNSLVTYRGDHCNVLEAECGNTVIYCVPPNYENNFKSFKHHIDIMANNRVIYLSSSWVNQSKSKWCHGTNNIKYWEEKDYTLSKRMQEKELTSLFGDNLSIVRFPSVHGRFYKRATRSDNMINQIATKQEIVLDRNIYQNRILVTDLADAVLNLAYSTSPARFRNPIFLGSHDSITEERFFKEVRKQLVLSGFKINNKVIRTKLNAPRLSLSVMPTQDPMFTCTIKKLSDTTRELVNLYRNQ